MGILKSHRGARILNKFYPKPVTVKYHRQDLALSNSKSLASMFPKFYIHLVRLRLQKLLSTQFTYQLTGLAQALHSLRTTSCLVFRTFCTLYPSFRPHGLTCLLSHLVYVIVIIYFTYIHFTYICMIHKYNT